MEYAQVFGYLKYLDGKIAIKHPVTGATRKYFLPATITLLLNLSK